MNSSAFFRFLHYISLYFIIFPFANAQAVRYIHTDGLGSVSVVTDANRNVIERREYEPYGANIGGDIDGVGYTGHVMDGTTGLTYMQQRYYDPHVGLFISVDPVAAYDGDARLFNRYTYAFNNPYKFNDVDGRCPVCPVLFGAVVGAGTNIAVQKILNPDKPVNYVEAAISAAAGAVSGGVGGFLVTAVARSTVSVGQAVAIQTAVNIGTGATSSAAQNLAEGKEISVNEATSSAVGSALGGLAGSGVGVALGDFAEASGKAAIQKMWSSTAAGLPNIASTTSSTGIPVATQSASQAAASQAGQAAAGGVANAGQKKWDEKNKR
ncbi:RHS repeat-associated core domain-containing protein [Xanthomonas sp. WHRI 7065]|uniref:RHS repeat-associated core domain-containing protein n=1 Tax=Xanthomonas sp. WHRI 7065 TaxID=3161569 RepID=UPI0032E8E531